MRALVHLPLDLDIGEGDDARADDASILGLGQHPLRLRLERVRCLERIVEVVWRHPHGAGVRSRERELRDRKAIAVSRRTKRVTGHFGGSDRA